MSPHLSPSRAGRGFTLVELLVAMLAGMALVLGVTVMLMRFESSRRTIASLGHSQTGAAYASYVLDRQLRSAGSGFMQGWEDALGCPLHVARGGSTLLPRGNAFPAPFAAVPKALRLAPLVAFAGAGQAGSDLLMVATGAAGLGEVPNGVLTGSAESDRFKLPATVGLRGGDLLLVAERGRGCMVQQVAAGFIGGADQQVMLGGTYAAATISGVALTDMGSTQLAWASSLGNVAGNLPSLRLYGVGDNATLVSHDLLRLDGSDTVQPEADGVVDLRVRYGVDTDDDGVLDQWVSPAATGWTSAVLLDGSADAQLQLRRIVAVQLALVLRDPSVEREPVAPASLTLFSGLPAALQISRPLAEAQRYHRHRVLEFTVPLRNLLLQPGS